jgi:hypothetical protein
MWQSIDSALQNGSTIIAREGDDPVACHWSAIAGHPQGGVWITHGRGLLRPFNPTEWLPTMLVSPASTVVPDQTPMVLLADGYVPVERTAMVEAVL